MNTRPILLCTLVVVLLAALFGCENRLTRENYDKIQPGMTLDQVTAILGPGEKQIQGGASKLAQGMIGDITMAQARQNHSQTKQGLSDLVKDRDRQTQREADGQNNQPHRQPGSEPKPTANDPSKPPTASIPVARPPASAAPVRNPIRDRWIWKTDGIEITIEFSDDVVTSKNQDGL